MFAAFTKVKNKKKLKILSGMTYTMTYDKTEIGLAHPVDHSDIHFIGYPTGGIIVANLIYSV